MLNVWVYALASVLLVSIISLLGIFALSVNVEKLKKILFLLVSFSAGALLGDVFIHLLPHIIEEQNFSLFSSLYILLGIAVLLFVEKVVKWRHCHHPVTKDHVHSFAVMNLVGDSMHNLIDGLVIGASYLVSIPVGIATTVAIVLHEIPQEIGDFGVLIHGGFTKTKALFLNFLTALAAVVGTLFALIINSYTENIIDFFVPLAAGGFIYIAAADLIPEMHKEVKLKTSIPQFLFFILGIGVMCLMLLIE
jgi:zinc and cadmium transporter